MFNNGSVSDNQLRSSAMSLLHGNNKLNQQAMLTNKVIIETVGADGKSVEVETYLADEHLLESGILCLMSVLAFYPTVYFLN